VQGCAVTVECDVKAKFKLVYTRLYILITKTEYWIFNIFCPSTLKNTRPNDGWTGLWLSPCTVGMSNQVELPIAMQRVRLSRRLVILWLIYS
jgi:hypothetical protein